MTKSLRQSTLQTLGLGTVLDIFKKGEFPANPADLVDQVFGNKNDRGSLVISGANGIVGAGKTMQLGSRLQSYDIPVVALTSYAMQGDDEKARLAGCTGYIAKPIDTRSFLDTVAGKLKCDG